MKKTVFAFLLMALVASCNKEDSNTLNGRTVVTGRLLDASTLEPIAGGTVTIEYGNRSMDTVTGPNGAYRFDFEHDEKYVYRLTAEANRYLDNKNIGIWASDYPSGKPSPSQRLKLNTVNQTDIKLPPEGFVEYHLKQINPYIGNIEVRILPYNSLSIISYNGQGLNIKYLDRAPGGISRRVGCSIIRDNDSLQSFSDTLLVPRFDTLRYTIGF
jgi:hypothetical protein